MQKLFRGVKAEKSAEAADHREGFTALIRFNESTNLNQLVQCGPVVSVARRADGSQPFRMNGVLALRDIRHVD
jgi:hypothetical protein